jgi:hypothetical protein
MALFSLIGANKICSITTPIGMRCQKSRILNKKRRYKTTF